jgi:hypothetical protein
MAYNAPQPPSKRPREALVDGAIHSLHRSLRERMSEHTALSAATTITSEGPRNVVDAWCHVWASVAESAEAASYAQAMDELFSKCAESTTLVVEILKRYFFKGSGDALVCDRGCAAFKQTRREFFCLSGRVMNAEELLEASIKVQQEHAILDRPLVVLDVGSCHGALQTLVESNPNLLQKIKITSLDLCPARPHVVQADWLTLPIPEVSSGASSNDIAMSSVDAVLMCYMLSFLPDGCLRWHACKRAALALVPGGLLIIMEPKRGVRRSKWAKRWADILQRSLGLELIREDQHLHTVVLLLSKQLSPGTNVADSLDFGT